MRNRLRRRPDASLREPIDLLVQVVHRVEQRLDAIEADLGALGAELQRRHDGVMPVLEALAHADAAHRRALAEARAATDYERAFTDPEPLVTVTIPTRDRTALLVERALPSVLCQTHRNLEVIVVGDMAGEQVGAAVAALGDERVRFVDLGHRLVHPDPERHWLAAATLPRNEGYRLARGLWTLDFDDDDALRPDAVARLLEHARRTRAEVVHGDFEQHAPGGSGEVLGSDPPERGRFSLAAALVHAGLVRFEREPIAAALGVPGDWFRVERMLRAGVRFAHLDGVVFDYYPTSLWSGAGRP